MDRDRFWDLVATTGAASEEGCERLTDVLSAQPPEEIAGFARILADLCAAAYRWDLWGAAYVANGGCSDDGFEYFLAWLVARGRVTYETVLRDPDALADYLDGEDCDHEPFRYVAPVAYRRRTGGPLPVAALTRSPEPSGELWDFDSAAEMRARYPRLCDRVDSRRR